MWRWYGCKQIGHLSDASFRTLFPFRQDPTGFLQDFHEAARLRFFFHPRNKKDFFLYLLTQTQPYEQVLADAQDVIENRFEAFGSGKITLGENIHWQRDFKSGKIWPMKYRLPFRHQDRLGDQPVSSGMVARQSTLGHAE
jgi:hypothetical protein